MGFLSRILLIVIIVLLIFTFIPKHNGSVICFGCEDRECDCFGLERDRPGGNDVCYGVPHSCEEIPEEEPVS